MSLRVVVASDDDIDIVGNVMADADFWDGDDGEVDAVNKVNPILRNLIVWENSTTADATNKRTRGEFQMNTWPNTRRIISWGKRAGGIAASEAASEQTCPGKDMLMVTDEMNLPCESGDDWISDNTKLYASVDNAQVLGVAFVYSYGERYPYRGGHMQWIRKVADAAETGADAFYQAWASDLTGTTPGLDPKKTYVLRGVMHEAAATAKAAIGAIVQPQASAFKIFGPAWSDFAMCGTIYMDDGILVEGQDGFVAKTGSGGAADTPYVWLGFEEYGGSGGRPAGLKVSPTGGTVKTGGGLGGMGGMGGIVGKLLGGMQR